MEKVIVDNIAATQGLWKDKTILIVEDVESNYQFLAATLRKSGAEILWAKSGEEALKLVSGDAIIDIVLMDVQLDGMDGYMVTVELKKIRPELPVIAQTAYAMKGEKEKSKAAGCDDYLSKPIRPSELLRTISRYL
ncbi:response regulator [Lentimicrobium saccharophilum]|nr:response regulator [Lentimicrobium saccharophilum]